MTATAESMIQKTPGVCGGHARVRNTRVTVWILVGYRQLGATEAQLLKSYPSLDPEDLKAAWQYYERHRHEIDQVIRQNDQVD